MTWREEAKTAGVPLYDHERKQIRKKVDVVADTQAKKEPEEVSRDTKVVISPRDATEICRKALFEYVSALGIENVTCERWFLNCKRKGIVFKGQRNGP